MSIDDEWIKNMRYLNTVECNSVLKKEGNPATCDNMDEPGGHYPQ